MTTLRGSFPTQIETCCEAGHVYRYSPLGSGECPICIDPPKPRGPMSESHKAKVRANHGGLNPLKDSERMEIQRLHELGYSETQIRLAVGRGAVKIREALKGAE